ncbi:Protein kinase C-binding protein nell2 [Goodea atripinnis]|uniref:Protein kinase C-binding protein nell2 n=1 Tax=Goodea atripinnis TaxID=208336 RepID=A0ABV0PFI0_9TELE
MFVVTDLEVCMEIGPHDLYVCEILAGQVMCRRMVCDCDNPNADLFCCPECDPRLSSQCLHQNGLLTYGSGDTWVENCQQCQCLVGL